jgi:bacteriocin-like protein
MKTLHSDYKKDADSVVATTEGKIMNEMRELTDCELQAVSGGGTWLQAAVAFVG